jgi:hypothetical protein
MGSAHKTPPWGIALNFFCLNSTARKQAVVQLDSRLLTRAVLLEVNGEARMIGEGMGNQKAKLKIVGAQNRQENIFHFPYYICHLSLPQNDHPQ